MTKAYYFLIFLFLTVYNADLRAQCTLDYTRQTVGGSILNTSGARGQSFEACQSGVLSELSFEVFSTQSSSGSLNIYEGAGTSGNVLASVPFSEITFVTSGSPTTVDLSSYAIEVASGSVYTFYFTSVTNVVMFTTGVYADGDYYASGNAVSGFELSFKVEITDIPALFVNGSTGSDTNDGSDFANAFATIQKALDTATPGSNIYVAAGTYYPTQGVDLDGIGGVTSREFTFQIPSGLKLYGGFAGTETSIDLSARDFVTNETILSGDLGTAEDDSDNAYHVVYTNNVGNSVAVSGFTIEDGNANGSAVHGKGGGWYNLANSAESSPSIMSTIFKDNSAASGGAFYNEGGASGTSSPVFRSAVFASNNATSQGGGLYNGIASSSAICSPAFYNCTFYDNAASSLGGAISSTASSTSPDIQIRNTIFFENTASSSPAVFLSSQRAKASYCMIDRPFLPSRVTDEGNNQLNADPLFESGSLFYLSDCSAAVDAGENSHVTESLDAAGNSRLQNSTVDIGAFEVTDPVKPEIGLSLTTVDFGQGKIGETLQETITISNTGTGDLDLTFALVGSEDFSIQTSPASVAEGSTADLIINYTPTAPNQRAANLLITSNDCDDSEMSVDLSGGGEYLLTYSKPYQIGTVDTDADIPFYVERNTSTETVGISMSADGSKAFLMRHDNSTSEVVQLALSAPYDVTNASEAATFSTTSQTTQPMDITFGSEGKKMFVLGGTDIHQYSLATPFDINSGVTYDGAYSVAGKATAPTGVTFSSNGSLLYVLDNATTDRIYDYSLTTPFDLINDEVTNSGFFFNVGNELSEPIDLYFSLDGMTLLVMDNQYVEQYSLTTSYNLFSATNSDDLRLNTISSNASGLFFTQNSEYLYLTEKTSIVRTRGIPFEAVGFEENNLNDGSVSGSMEIHLSGTTFVNAGSDLVESTHYTISNLPSGLMPNVAISADGQTATLTFDDNADANESANDVSNLAIVFTDAAINGANFSEVTTLGKNVFSISFEDNPIPEAPTITSSTSFSVAENSADPIFEPTADEPVVFELGSLKDEAFFRFIDGDIYFVSAPDFENPEDANMDNVYLIDLVARNPSGNSSTLEISINVTDIDEVFPTITSALTNDLSENSNISYEATADEAVTFSLGSAKDEALFDLTGSTISFLTEPDFENPQDGDQNNVYVIDLIATDVENNKTTAQLTIHVRNINDNTPVITAGQSFRVDENVPFRTVIGTIEATDPDVGGSLEGWTIVGTNYGLIVNQNTGEIEVELNAELDFEKNESLELEVSVSDGIFTSETETIIIHINDLNDNKPVIATPSQSFSIAENAQGGTSIVTLTASDEDANTTFSNWIITSGNDGGQFSIDSGTGEVSVANGASFNSETQSSYQLSITVSDGLNASEEASITINVLEENAGLQTISFTDDLTGLSYGDKGIELKGTASSNLAVTYAFTGPVKVTGNKLDIIGVGSASVTATQIGNGDFIAAEPVTINFTIQKASLVVTADNQAISVGDEIPNLTFSYAGFKLGEGVDELDEEPQIATDATIESPAGTYSITLSGGSDKHYDFELINGELTIEGALGFNAEAVLIYPNPVTDFISIQGKRVASMTLLTLNGKIMKTERSLNSMDVSAMAQGGYILQIKDTKGGISSHIIIKR